MNDELNYAIAVATARILTGILFFFQGYDKVFNVGLKEVKRTMTVSLMNIKIPAGIIGLVAVATSIIELTGGLLLILGLYKSTALYLLCANLLIVTTGFSLVRPMWDSGHVLIRLALLLFLLVTPSGWDWFSIDALFISK
jgi:uncharacterized membrane protein YphA (DoxX/SURF4 family)